MQKSSRFFKIALVLGLLSAIGPFAIDMYLPALPQIGKSLQADINAVQMSLTAFFISMGVGQLIYGPVSDMLGRKLPLYFGLALFTVASVGCALATDINTLVWLRFVQGLGAAAGMAIPRAVVRDLHTGADAARLMSLLMLVFSVSPILAPLVGSVVIALGSWRSVFWGVALAGLAGLLLTRLTLTETRPPEARQQSSLKSAVAAYSLLLRDRYYMGLVMIGAFAMGGFFTYLANSSFVMIGHYGLTPTQYSLAFALNAASFIGVSQFTGMLCARFGLVRVVQGGVLGCCAVMLLMLGLYLLGVDRLEVLIGLFLIASGFMGLVIPTTAVLALEAHGRIAGTASALMGTMQMLIGAAAMGLVARFSSDAPLPMVMGMTLGPLLAAVLTWRTLGGPQRPDGSGQAAQDEVLS